MTQTSSHPQPPAELHWGIAYLREDIQDLRTEIRGIHTRIDGLRSDTTAQFDRLRGEVDAQINGLRGEMNSRFSRMDTRFWLQTALILSSWISLVGLLVFK